MPSKVVLPAPVITFELSRADSLPPSKVRLLVLLIPLAVIICPAFAVKVPLFVTESCVIVFEEAEISFTPLRANVPLPSILPFKPRVSAVTAALFVNKALTITLLCVISALLIVLPLIVVLPSPVIAFANVPPVISSSVAFATAPPRLSADEVNEPLVTLIA